MRYYQRHSNEHRCHPQVETAPDQQIPNLEISLICVTTAGKSIVAGYFSFRLLLEVGIRHGHEELTCGLCFTPQIKLSINSTRSNNQEGQAVAWFNAGKASGYWKKISPHSPFIPPILLEDFRDNAQLPDPDLAELACW